MADINLKPYQEVFEDILDMKILDFLTLCAEKDVDISLLTSALSVCLYKMVCKAMFDEDKQIGVDFGTCRFSGSYIKNFIGGIVMFGLLSSMQLFLTSFMMFLTGEGAAQLDTALVGEVMDIVVEVITKAVALFALFPLNLFLILGLIGLSVGFFFTLKRGARR